MRSSPRHWVAVALPSVVVLVASLLAVGCGGASPSPPAPAGAGPGGAPPNPPEPPPDAPAAAPVVAKQFAHVRDQVERIGLSPDGKFLAAGCKDGTLKLWDVASGKVLATLALGRVNSVVFSPDSKSLAAGKSRGDVTVRAVPGGDETCEITTRGGKGVTSTLHAVGFLPDGKGLVTYGYPGPLRVWDIDSKAERASWGGLFSDTEAVALGPDGTWAAFGRGAQGGEKPELRVGVNDIPSGKPRGKPLTQTEGTETLAVSPDGKRLASVKGWASHPSTTVNLWDLPTGQLQAELKGHTQAIRALAFSPNGKYLASGGWDNTVRIWDAEAGKPVTEFKVGGWVYGLSFGPESKTLVVGGWMPNVTLYDLTPTLPPERK